jgi:hypothetical protein
MRDCRWRSEAAAGTGVFPAVQFFAAPEGTVPLSEPQGCLYRAHGSIAGLMRVKTSITLPAELLARLDRLQREEQDRRDIEIINRHAERLNRGAMDTLEYQQLPPGWDSRRA